MNKVLKILLKIVASIVIFLVGSISVTIANELIGGIVVALIPVGMALFFIWFWGLWDKWFKKEDSPSN